MPPLTYNPDNLRVTDTGGNHVARTNSILERSTRISGIPEDTECHVDNNDDGNGAKGNDNNGYA
jgi:hypothetical protein